MSRSIYLAALRWSLTPVLTAAQVDKTIAWFNTTRKTPYKLKFADVSSNQLASVVSKEVLGR